MSIDSDKTSYLSSPDNRSEGYEHEEHTLSRSLSNVSRPSLGGRQVEHWSFSTLPKEMINHIFGYWIVSVADVCTARRIFKPIDHLPEEYSPYRVFVNKLSLPVDPLSYPDSAMTIEFSRDDEEPRLVNFNDFLPAMPSKRSFFIYNRMYRKAMKFINKMQDPHSQLKALLELQRLMPGIDMFENAKNLLSQMHMELQKPKPEVDFTAGWNSDPSSETDTPSEWKWDSDSAPSPKPAVEFTGVRRDSESSPKPEVDYTSEWSFDSDPLPKPEVDYTSEWSFDSDPLPKSNKKFNRALIEVLKTYPNQKVLEDQEERIIEFFDSIKTLTHIRGKLREELAFICNNVSVFANTIPKTDIHDFFIRELVGSQALFLNLLKYYLDIGRIDNARELFKYFDRNKNLIGIDSLINVINDFPQIKEIEIVIEKLEELKDKEIDPFKKAYWQIKIAVAKESLEELEGVRVLLLEAMSLQSLNEVSPIKNTIFLGSKNLTFLEEKELMNPQVYDLGLGIISGDQQEQSFELECFTVRPIKDFLDMKIFQAFLKLNELDKAKEFRHQLEGSFQQFQAQLEILKKDPSRVEFDVARALALRTKEKDILLMQLITEYFKADGQDKLARAIEIRDQIENPYYKIKVQIQIIRASESVDAKAKMNEFMACLQRADRRHWIQILEHQEKLSFFQRKIKSQEVFINESQLKTFQKNYSHIKHIQEGYFDGIIQEDIKKFTQEVQEELMYAYIQKEDFTSAIEVAQVMTRDKLQRRDNCILNLIDELLKRERVQEAKNLLSQLEGSSLFKAIAQVRIARASSDDKWQEEFSTARDLIEAISQESFISTKEDVYYAKFYLLAACMERNDSDATDMLLSEIKSGLDDSPETAFFATNDLVTQNLFNSFLKRKEFQIAETVLDLIPNPKVKLEALTTLIEAMFKPRA